MTLTSLLRKCAAFRADRRGGIALMTAMCAPFIFAAAAFSIDFANASYVNQRLAEAADAAVLAAVAQSTANTGGGYSDTAWLQAYGSNVFQGNIAKLNLTSITDTLTVTPNGTGGVTASISYSAQVPTFFGGLIGMINLNVKSSASATANPLTYINYYIIVDISQSMGIGSTATDMSNLYALTQATRNTEPSEPGCVFGCHVPLSGQTVSTESLAHNANPRITLRIDAAVSAIQSIISAAQTAAGVNKNIKIGLYTMSEDPTVTPHPYINTVSALSSNYTTLATDATNIDLGNNTSAGYGDSNFPEQLSTFNANILPAIGSGAAGTAANPINYVFIITDGVTDIPGSNCTDTHCTSVFDSSQCASLKAKATVGVIYTTYLPIYQNNNTGGTLDTSYAALVAPFVNNIVPALEACASSQQYYFEASNGPQITAGMQSLFASSEQAARLTN